MFICKGCGWETIQPAANCPECGVTKFFSLSDKEAVDLAILVERDAAAIRRESTARGGGLKTLCFIAQDLGRLGWRVEVSPSPRPALRNWLLSEEFRQRFQPHRCRVKPGTEGRANPSVELVLRRNTFLRFLMAAQAVIQKDEKRIEKELGG